MTREVDTIGFLVKIGCASLELAEFGYFDLSKSRIELRDPAGNTKLAQNRLPLYFALFLLSAVHSRLRQYKSTLGPVRVSGLGLA